jgi:hypothetical protein
VWIGDKEDVMAWDLLWDAREAFSRGVEATAKGHTNAPTQEELAQAQESLLAAEGSDWCWWYGPEHSTANDAEFDALYRKHLTAVYGALGQVPPEELAKPIKRLPERAYQLWPSSFLKVDVDGLDSTYFEWLGAGVYSPERRGGAMHGRVFYLKELRYGFEKDRFVVRVDCFAEALEGLKDAEFRIVFGGLEETTVVVKLERGKMKEYAIEKGLLCLLNPAKVAEADYVRILEVAVTREVLELAGLPRFRLGVALWHAGLPVDVLPAEGNLDVQLGEENYAWGVEGITS